MADPATIAIIAGGGLQAASTIQQGRIAEAQGEFEEEIALRNQKALERQAKAEQEAAGVEAGRISRKQKFIQATQIATAAKSGGGLAGASVNVLADTAFQFSLERNLALRTGLIRSQELIERGGIIAAQGRFAKSVGKSAKRASILGAAGIGARTAGLATLKGRESDIGRLFS